MHVIIHTIIVIINSFVAAPVKKDDKQVFVFPLP